MINLKCWCLFLLIYLCVRGSFAIDVKEVQLNIYWDKHYYCQADRLDIEVGGRFQFHLNFGNTFIHDSSRCNINYRDSFRQNEDLFINKAKVGYTSGILLAPSQLGDWNYDCEVHTTPGVNQNIGILCSVQVYVRPKQTVSCFLLVNNIKYTSTPNSEEHQYRYRDGEGIIFHCQATSGRTVMLTYFNITQGPVQSSSGWVSTSAKMYKKLRTSNNNDIVECACAADLNNAAQYIRMKLTEQTDSRGMLAFIVNGLIITENKHLVNETYLYEYKYYDGEYLTVGVVKDDHIYGDKICEYNKKIKNVSYFELNSKKNNFMEFTLNKVETNWRITCYVLRDSSWYSMILQFLVYTPEYSPYMTGLSMSNVLLQYSNATSNIIEYEIGSDLLKLCCYLLSKKLGTLYYNDGSLMPYNDYNNSCREVQLRPDVNSATIQCSEYIIKQSKTTYLKLVRGIHGTSRPTATTVKSSITFKDITQSSSRTELTPRATTPCSDQDESCHKDTTISSIQDTTTIPISITPTPPFSEGIVWGIVITVVVAVLLVAVGLWKIYSNKKKRLLEYHNYSNAIENYENLPEYHEGPMATPSQWNRPDGVVHSDNNFIRHVDTKSVAEDDRKNASRTAKPIKFIGDPNIFQINNVPTYASVQDNEPVYAAVQQSDPTYSNVQKSEPTYATVQKSAQTYATVQKNKPNYVNQNENHSHLLEKSVFKSNDQDTHDQDLKDILYTDVYDKNANDTNFNAYKMPVYSETVPEKTYVNHVILSNMSNYEN